MCTVIFIPAGDTYFFASLRDENPLRPGAAAPTIYKRNDVDILSPVDAQAGGSWLGINNKGCVIILLNGGFEKHERQSSYRKSRGLILSELLSVNEPVEDWHKLELQEIEPFTLVIWQDGTLYLLVWDGSQKHSIELPSNQPCIWSSATLYNEQARSQRRLLFDNWVAKNISVTNDSLLDFFKTFTDNENGFLMNRQEQVKTLSYSFINLAANVSATLNYTDFLQQTQVQQTIPFNRDLNKSIIKKQAAAELR